MGLAFGFDESEYIETNKFFVSASEEYKETEFKSDLNETLARGNVTHNLFSDLMQDIPWKEDACYFHNFSELKKWNRYSYVSCFGKDENVLLTVKISKCLKMAMYIVQNYYYQKMINV